MQEISRKEIKKPRTAIKSTKAKSACQRAAGHHTRNLEGFSENLVPRANAAVMSSQINLRTA